MTPGWISRLERRFGGFAIENLAAFIVAMNAAVWGLSLLKPEFPSLLALEPSLLLRGQIWRAATFLFIPPPASPFWMIFWLYLLYLYAGALEREWGDFCFNVFYAAGALSLLAASLALGVGLPNTALNLTLFLAFASLFPDFELLLFFIIPVKVWWLAAAVWVWLAWILLAGDIHARATVLASLANYALFFGSSHWDSARARLRKRLWERKLK
ncbi:MAG: hypothetical protein HY922_02345 [Elusimicrobia bacterium]|nr:hypothetical protein [Elusimicrobiota bacterium]